MLRGMSELLFLIHQYHYVGDEMSDETSNQISGNAAQCHG